MTHSKRIKNFRIKLKQRQDYIRDLIDPSPNSPCTRLIDRFNGLDEANTLLMKHQIN